MSLSAEDRKDVFVGFLRITVLLGVLMVMVIVGQWATLRKIDAAHYPECIVETKP